MKAVRWITTLVLTTVWAGGSLAGQPIGQVISLQGEARAVRPDGTAEQLALESEIYLYDRIQTMSDAKLQIILVDDAVVAMGADSNLTIDEFVYNPEQKEENSTAIGLIQGVFRVITARITDMNPEQFKVKSNKATIGIRGCELGFVIGADAEEIQIVRLPERKLIRVESNEAGAGTRTLDILQQGTLVRVDADGGMDRLPLSVEAIADVIAQTTPQAVATEKTPARLTSGVDAFEEASGLGSDAPEVAAGARVSDSGVVIQSDTAVLTSRSTDELARIAVAGQARGELLDMPTLPEPVAVEVPRPPEEEGVDLPTPPADVPASVPGSNGEPFPRIGTPVQVASASGDGWSWGAWEQVDVLNAAGETRSTFSVRGSNSGVTPAALNDLLNGPNRVTLEGNIQAAAALAMADRSRLLITDGGANLFSVTAGFGALAPWSADMSLASAQGDQLVFSANGFVSAADGSLGAPASSYSLTAFGQGYGADSLSANQLSGTLVGGERVTGVAGSFRFEHGGGPSVNGAFGANLAPVP